ncbi:MAG TPA: ATP-binding cassette domain-containing protein [Chthonomonadaceae bacterium]|nr:ATP-binding cassette domain-containing protein [Chthonomonadaceae bacterium]
MTILSAEAGILLGGQRAAAVREGSYFPLSSALAAEAHCRVRLGESGGDVAILSDAVPTYLNGVRLAAGGAFPLQIGDILRVGLDRFRVCEEGSCRTPILRHHCLADPSQMQLVVRGLDRRVRRDRKALLQGIRFVIEPNELVGIVGCSGSGKSTLLRALTGFDRVHRHLQQMEDAIGAHFGRRPRFTGRILYNGLDFENTAEPLRRQMGYVPQEEIVHTELTADAVLGYAARLRLPYDTRETQIAERIEEVLQELRLESVRDIPIRLLSGGERKRVNVAVDLLTRPAILFLDEPTSGLDPGFEVEFMERMRALTLQGHTVVLTTHSEHCMRACDRLILLTPHGRLAFCGTADEALQYFCDPRILDSYRKKTGQPDFAVRTLSDVFTCVGDRRIRPEYWERRFKIAREARRPLDNATADLAALTSNEKAQIEAALEQGSETPSLFRQFHALRQRYWQTIKADRGGYLLAVLAAPFMALFLGSLFPADIFTSANPRTLTNIPAFLLFMVISPLFFGLSNAAKEFTRERSIYRRERLAGLRLDAYFLSKLTILGGISALQSLLLLGLVMMRIDLPFAQPHNVGVTLANVAALLLALWLASLAGTTLGLVVSACAETNDQAMKLIPLAVLPQLFFAGPFSLLRKPIIMAISQFFPTYWAIGALGYVLNVNARFTDAQTRYIQIPAAKVDIGLSLVALTLIGAWYGALSAGILWWKQDNTA